MSEISGYKIVKELGHGGMSTVYLAIQKSVSRYVALKVMSSQLVDDETFTRRFLSEARIAARFRHPNIISIYDVNVSEGIPYIAMEYVPGGELTTERIKSMTLTEKLSVLVQIADALAFLHKLNFVHRDIKPGNILFREDKTVVLTDFGVARDQTSRQHDTLAGFIIGTPHYLSPEQARGRSVDARSDIYSLGVLTYRMLTARLPFVADDAIAVCTMHVNADVPDLPKECEKFDGIVKKAMAKSPEDRYQSANDYIDALISVTGSETAKLLRRSVEGVALQAINPEDEPTTTQEQIKLSQSDLRTRIQPSLPTASLIQRKVRRLCEATGLQRILGWFGKGGWSTQRAMMVGGASLALVVTFMLVMVVFPRHWVEKDALSKTSQIEVPAVIAPQSEVTQEVSIPIAETESEARIKQLLAQGHQALNQGIYVQPLEFSALGYFNAVLEQDPSNEAAHAGLVALADALLELLEASLAQGQSQIAEQFLADARRTGYADPVRLARLEDALTVRPEPIEDHSQEIAERLATAREFLSRNQLTQPDSANAVAEFRKVLEVDAGNAEALAGLEQVGIRYLELAMGQISIGDWSQAENYWQKSDSFAPGVPGAAEVREAIEAHKAQLASARQTPEAKEEAPASRSLKTEITAYPLPVLNLTGNESVEALYNQAEQAMKSGDRMRAYAFYKEVWEQNPGYARAEKRLSSGAGSYLNVASRDIELGNLHSAHEALTIALALDPGHPKFNPVKRDYLAAVDRAAGQSATNGASASIADIRIRAILEDAESHRARFETDSTNRRAAQRALERYREVLDIRPDDRQARAGLARLLQDLLAATRLALTESRVTDAEWYLASARFIDPAHPDLVALERQLN